MHHTSLAQLTAGLRSLAIPRNSVVMVHSSLFGFGIIEQGVAGVYDTLWKVLGPGATVVMPAFIWDNADWYCDSTPSQVGALTEYHRKWGVRTVHPYHSVVAVGPYAGDFVKCDCLTSWGPGSPFALLRDLDAYNLSIGIGFVGGATFLHTIEEERQVPYREFKAFPATVYGPCVPGLALEKLCGKRDDRAFGLYARIVTDAYEYVGDWAAAERDLAPHFTTTLLKGTPLSVCHIPPVLDSLRTKILTNPFYAARVEHKGAA